MCRHPASVFIRVYYRFEAECQAGLGIIGARVTTAGTGFVAFKICATAAVTTGLGAGYAANGFQPVRSWIRE
jgi:hypothetical protein